MGNQQSIKVVTKRGDIWFHRAIIFFLALLISSLTSSLKAQVQTTDTLKNVTADSLDADSGGEELAEKVNYSAEDSVVALPDLNRVILYGKARVEYEGMTMEAEYLDINYATSVVKAFGRRDSLGQKVGTPLFKEGEQRMEADTIKYNLKTKKGKIYNALTQQGDLLVHGREIKKDSNDVTYFKNMRCLPCQDEDARTAFVASKAKIIPNDKIVTGPMFLQIGGVPTPLGLPFGYFPNSKKQFNGILFPTYGRSESQGFFLRQGGFYWGINDKTEMLFRGDVYTNGSWMLGVTNNYNVRYKGAGSVYVSHSRFNFGDRDIPAEFTQQRAMEFNWRHAQDNLSNPTLRFSANVNFRNNQQFNRLNAINSGQYLQPAFLSNVAFTKIWKFGSLGINAQHDQNAQSGLMNITLPSITFNVNRFFPFKRENAARPNVFDKIQVGYDAQMRNTLSGRDSTIFKGDIADKLQYGIRHSMPIQTNFNVLKYITATPAVNLTSVMYDRSIRREYIPARDTVIERFLKRNVAGYDAVFSTAFNTQVFFDYHFFGGPVKQIRHRLIPTLTYIYRPDYGEEQFGFWKSVQLDSIGNMRRYSIFERGIFQGPGIGKQNALAINLNNNIEAKVKQRTDTGIVYNKVVVIQELSLNSNYNFAADSFKMSGISGSARTVLFKHLDVVAAAGMDPYVYNRQTNTRRDQFQFARDGRLARITNMAFTLGSSIGSNMLEAMRKLRESPDPTNAVEQGGGDKAASGGIVPWNLRLTYVLQLTNSDDRRLQPSQQLNFNGDIAPTKFWRVGFTSGVDFNTQNLSYTSLNIYRDLKCWEARIDWVPFGRRRMYMLTINLKTPMLSEFRIPRQRQWFDNF